MNSIKPTSLARQLVLAFLLSLLAAAMVAGAAAATARLDMSFGTNGRSLTPLPAAERFPNSDFNSVVDEAGQILTVGSTREEQFMLLRYLPNGKPDPSFGQGGAVVSPFQGKASDLALDSQGRIVVVGSWIAGEERTDVSLIARYRSDGSVDTGFADGGLLVTRKPKQAFAVAVDDQDRIVVAGIGANDFESRGVVARYDPDGSEDPSFEEPDDIASTVGDLLIDPAGRILVAGETRVRPSRRAPQVRRLLPDGGLDQSFAEGGERLLSGERFARTSRGAVSAVAATGLALDSEGRVLVSLSTGAPEPFSRGAGFAAVRLHPDGDLDADFGKRGRVAYPMTNGKRGESALALGVFVDAAERVLIGGTVGAGPFNRYPEGFGLIRLRENGRPDPGFRPHGRLRIGFGRVSVLGGAPQPLSGSRVLLAGQGRRGEEQFGVLARVSVRGG